MKSPARVEGVSAPRVSALGLFILFAVFVTDGLAQFSPVQPAPPLPSPSGSVVSVSTVSALQSAVATLTSGTTILISPGVYRLTQELRIRSGVTNVALRGATNNRDDVVILGTGMNTPGVNIPVKVENAQDVLIANLSIGEAYYHPIQLQGEAGAERVRVYNVRLFDAGQQFLKSTVNPASPNGVDDGVVEYSLLEYTSIGPAHGYTEGIDVHHGARWIIRYNLFRNIHVPATAPDKFRPAILMWSGSRDTLVDSNVFIDCERGIIFGLGPQAPYAHSHSGGTIVNNFIYRTQPVNADAGISVWDSPGTRVLHNTVIQNGTYRNAIEYRFPGTTGVEIINNLTDGQIQQRDAAQGSVYSNYTAATPAYFINPGAGDLHLTATATAALDRGVYLPLVERDWDGEPRIAGAAADLGADERRETPPGSGASAAFVAADTTTQGNWSSSYGTEGYAIVGDATSMPAYATLTPSQQSFYVWAASTTDGRGLRRSSGTDRLAATWYGAAFDLDLTLNDGQPHQVAFYVVDWDTTARSQRIDVLDATTGAVLDTRTITDYHGGQYLVWTLTGPRPTAVHVARWLECRCQRHLFRRPGHRQWRERGVRCRRTTTQGNWSSSYGTEGYAIVGDATNLPAYATLTPSQQSFYVWAASTTDGRGLRRSSGTDRLAATWYGAAFDLDLTLNDGQPHQVAFYVVDWDTTARSQRIDVLDATTGAVLDTRTITDYHGGQYLVWTLTGHVRLRFTSLAGWNTVVSGIFFGGAAQ